MAGTDFSVVLVNPPVDVVREEIYDTPDYPCIGIAYVGGHLESSLGVSATILDARLARLTFDQTVERIVAANPRVVGLTAFTHTIVLASRLAEAVKRLLPQAVIVAGGYHVTYLPERSIKEFPSFDYLVAGEGEIAFSKLVDALRNGNPEPAIPGLWYRRKDGSVVAAGRGEVTLTLDDFGAPAWHLFDQESFRRHVRLQPMIACAAALSATTSAAAPTARRYAGARQQTGWSTKLPRSSGPMARRA